MAVNTWTDYELLDFGDGRKLERFGEQVFDRPSPGVQTPRKGAVDWKIADGRYTGAKVGDGKWKFAASGKYSGKDSPAISVPLGDSQFQMQLDLSPAGQVGLFPEQYANWCWIAKQVARLNRPLKVLNLFAFTGGSTLATAAAGRAVPHAVEVTHVDAAKPSVLMAKQNAEASGLAGTPIRWIVEDVVKYCRREVKRGVRYDGIILDPPSYGHGPKGEDWRLDRDLLPLLELCSELTERRPGFLLATCHTPSVGVSELTAYLSDGIFGHCGQPPSSGKLWLKTPDGRRLESGVYARWPK